MPRAQVAELARVNRALIAEELARRGVSTTIVRAKFRVTEVKSHMGSAPSAEGAWLPAEMRSVHLTPVTGNSDENKVFWNATPSGQIDLGVINLEAAVPFELNREFYVDFIPADAPRSAWAEQPGRSGIRDA